ncbi:MAG: sugar transferase [Saprospiraceae bacterium]
MVLLQTLFTSYPQTLEQTVPISFVKLFKKWVNLEEGEQPIVVETVSELDQLHANLKNPSEKAKEKCIISLKQVNNIRFVNKFFESANQKLEIGGHLFGFVETADQRHQRLVNKYPSPINKAYCTLDYWVKRVWPKMPYLKHYYFLMTGGRNRVISEMETYGRLYSCGFRLVESKEVDGKLYFVAKKVGGPDYNKEATYGPLIKLKRVGKNGKLIKVLKFRTMYPYSEYIQEFIYERNGLGDGAKFKDDPRVNSAGHFMRKYWLDELPMLINLVKGDVKIFGVRPISRHYFSLYSEEFQAYRNKFKPGLIPPVYVEIPNSVEDTALIEERYLRAYEKQPLLTDLRYMGRFIKNILFKKVRSH